MLERDSETLVSEKERQMKFLFSMAVASCRVSTMTRNGGGGPLLFLVGAAGSISVPWTLDGALLGVLNGGLSACLFRTLL